MLCRPPSFTLSNRLWTFSASCFLFDRPPLGMAIADEISRGALNGYACPLIRIDTRIRGLETETTFWESQSNLISWFSFQEFINGTES